MMTKKLVALYHRVLTPPYHKKDFMILGVTVLVVVGLPLFVYTAKQEVELRSHASETLLTEPENGTLAGNVSVIDDSNASGGKYIRLGTYVEPSVTPTPGQTLGCGGIQTPAPGPNVVLTTSNSTSSLSISSGGTASSPKIYDGQCYTVGRININASNVVVQNFRVNANSQYGIYSEGTNITIQNNDIKGVRPTGDGDLNAITFFGNGTKIMYNTGIDFVTGDPGDSHTDAIQTWVSSSHPTASANVIIKGNKFTGPANPSRNPSIPSIHQCIMAEGLGRGGNSGGNGDPNNWLIADNHFSDSWNQCIKLDGIDNVHVTRNEFAGSSTKIMDVTSASSGVKYYSDNQVTGNYTNGVGFTVTQGPGPTGL
jgi:hypothetical protein